MAESVPVERASWSQLPVPPARRFPAWPLVAWLVAAGPVAVQLDRLGHQPGDVRRILGVTFFATVLGTRRWRAAPLAFVAGLGLLLLAPSVPPVNDALAIGLCGLWCLVLPAVGDRWPRLRTLPGRVLAGVVLVAVTVALVAQTGVRVPLGLAAVAVGALLAPAVLPALFRPLVGPLDRLRAGALRLGRANGRLLDRIGRPIGVVLGAVAMVPAALLVAVVWVVHRITRYDVLAPPVAAGSRWVQRLGGDADGSRAFAAISVWDPRGIRRTLHRQAGTVLSLAIVAGAVVLLLPDGTKDVTDRLPTLAPKATRPGPADADDLDECLAKPLEPNPIFRGQPHAHELVCEQQQVVRRMVFDPATGYFYPDFQGTYVHFRNGVRRTWRAPACSCRRVKVWWFGGSAAWGWDQRDDFTIPSELAKAAWKEGIALDIENRAMPAWVLGQEARRFQQLLLDPKVPKPDLVWFYDGGNELNRQKERNGRGRGTDESETSWFEAELDDFLWNGPQDTPISERTTYWKAGPQISPEQVAHHAVDRYVRDIDLAKVVAKPAGLQPTFVWQVLRHSAPVAARRPGGVPAEDDPIWARMVPQARKELPKEVVDLGDALDGVRSPVFDDFYHHDERAARIVAAALLDELRPQVEAAAAGRKPVRRGR